MGLATLPEGAVAGTAAVLAQVGVPVVPHAEGEPQRQDQRPPGREHRDHEEKRQAEQQVSVHAREGQADGTVGGYPDRQDEERVEKYPLDARKAVERLPMP